jgi:rifampicin phosphotransferase
LKMLPGLVLNLGKLLFGFFRLPKLVPAFHKRFQQHYHLFYQQNFTTLSTTELIKQKELLDRELLQNWTTPIINDFYVMMTSGDVVRKLKRAGIQDANEFLSRFLSGDHFIESAQPTRDMQILAADAWKDNNLRELIISLPPDLHDQVKVSFPEFYGKVLIFINRFGDRTVGELKLETKTMRLEPYIFYQYLKNYLVSDKCPVIPITDTLLHKNAKAELKDLLRYRSIFFRRRTWKRLKNLQQAIRNREALRLERTRLFGMYRTLYLAIGERLVQQKKLDETRDIFYLSEEEILTILSEDTNPTVAQRIANRIQEYDNYKKINVASRMILPSPPVKMDETRSISQNQLFGKGCYPGIVTGEVIVIKEPADGLQVADKIICALRTDPGWAVLFPNSKGVLIEKGSSLSHSVILLRELGIPTIINIPGLTQQLHTGQTVLMNGLTGEVNKLN